MLLRGKTRLLMFLLVESLTNAIYVQSGPPKYKINLKWAECEAQRPWLDLFLSKALLTSSQFFCQGSLRISPDLKLT